MAVSFCGKKMNMYDRSLLYMSQTEHFTSANEKDLAGYARSLFDVGVDMLIIPADSLSFWKRMVPELPLLCATNYKYSKYQNEASQIIRIVLQEIRQMAAKMKKMNKKERARITSVCLVNFDLIDYAEYQESIKQFKNDFPKIQLGMAPANQYQTGSAVAAELSDVFDFVVASFAGKGLDYDDVPLEQILLSAVIFGDQVDIPVNLNILQQIKKQYERITAIKIADQSPVIGEKIFYYESAIHADGIEKNPKTYEPFAPESVGLQRKMFLGKHSGIKSIEKKMTELSFPASLYCLEKIKEKIKQVCIVNKEYLDDDLFSAIVQDSFVCR